MSKVTKGPSINPAVTSDIVPTGSADSATGTFCAGLAAGTLIHTLDGTLPVEFLCPGDRIITRDGARVLRELHSVMHPTVTVACISKSALGHGRPADDMVVGAAQQLLLRDWRAKALFGRPSAVVRAARIADGTYIRTETRSAMRLFQLAFDRPVTVLADGAEFPCEAATIAA